MNSAAFHEQRDEFRSVRAPRVRSSRETLTVSRPVAYDTRMEFFPEWNWAAEKLGQVPPLTQNVAPPAMRVSAPVLSWISALCSGACGLDTFGINDGAPGMTSGDSTMTASSSSDIRTTSTADTTATTEDAPTSSETNGDVPPAVPELLLSFQAIKQFNFTWPPAPAAAYYQLLESPSVGKGLTMLADDILGESISVTMPLHLRRSASYVLRACNDIQCTESAEVTVMDSLAAAVGYFKASNTGADDRFGHAVAISGDGSTLAIGAPDEDSSATGVGGDQTDDTSKDAGAVYVFRNVNGVWAQQAYIKASNTNAGDNFGSALSFSTDGNTLAVGAPHEDSSATGVGGNPNDNMSQSAGAVYVFTRTADTWTQREYIKATNSDAYDYFGDAVSLSGVGDLLAVSASNEDSNATGVAGDQTNSSAIGAGAVYTYTFAQNVWTHQEYIKASNTGMLDRFGGGLALSTDGSTLAVGAPAEDSSARGVDADSSDNASESAGAVYVFASTGNTWTHQAYIKASNTGTGDLFGGTLSLSSNGSTLAVGATAEDSDATNIGGDEENDNAVDSGAAYVFTRSGGEWTQQAYVKASNTDAEDLFGGALSLSADGDTLAVGAGDESSSATGVGGDQDNNIGIDSGAVYVLGRENQAWAQRAYVKAPDSEGGDQFGCSLSLSGDGHTLAVGAALENGAAVGVGGDQMNGAMNAGAAYLF